MASNTKARIIDTAIHLYNEQGFHNVTTSALAEEVGIAEGNLWYHFNNKQALLEAIHERFLANARWRHDVRTDEGDVLDGYIRLLLAQTSEIRQFRFMFRDNVDQGADTDFRREVPRVYDETIKLFRRCYDRMREEGHMRIAPDRLNSLITNVIVVLRFHLEFERESIPDDLQTRGGVARAIEQHFDLLRDHLTPQALTTLHSKLRAARAAGAAAAA